MITLRRIVMQAVPAALLVAIFHRRTPALLRWTLLLALLAFWALVYVRYRRWGVARTREEREYLRHVPWAAFWRHYNEQVPTIEEEFEIWSAFDKHRHEMRYDIVAAEVLKHLPPQGRVLDIGCGSANVADRIRRLTAEYVGVDFPEPNMLYAARKYSTVVAPLRVRFVRGDAARLPLASGSVDVVVLSEVIEHLLRPELAVWEIARVMRPGAVLIMTTNNASEAPGRSPLSHAFVWLERMVGADVPSLISYRPWIWPHRVDPALLPAGSSDVYLPHTHHISAETRNLFTAAGLETVKWGTFEFPPPQSVTAHLLTAMESTGRRVVDVLEAIAQRTPLIRRFGTHLLIVARKSGSPISRTPPADVWPGPLSTHAELEHG